MADAPFRAPLLEQIHPEAEDLLRSAGFEVESIPRALDEDELIAAADRIAVASNVQVSGYFQQKIAESPGLTSVYDLILKEAPGHTP